MINNTVVSDDSNQLVKGLIENFEAKGLEITHANYGGFEKPEQISGHKPDVIAWDAEKELYHIGSVTDMDTLQKDNGIKNRIETLSNLMMGQGTSAKKRIPYYVVLPKQSEVTQIFEKIVPEQDNINRIEV